MKSQWLTIKQLDQQVNAWQVANTKYGKPRNGWIKTIRKALNMTSLQLASRLGLTRARIVKLENAETHDAITLRTLREAAEALGCELVYAIVPKGESTLEGIIKDRAEQLATEHVTNVAHSMSLESQSINTEMLQIQKNELVRSLLENVNKKFWATSTEHNNQKELHNKLIANLKKKK